MTDKPKESPQTIAEFALANQIEFADAQAVAGFVVEKVVPERMEVASSVETLERVGYAYGRMVGRDECIDEINQNIVRLGLAEKKKG